jgi:hypothetical protein
MDEDLSRMIHPDSLPDRDSSMFLFREKRGKGSAEVVVNEATTENSSFENSKEEAWEGRRKPVSALIIGDALRITVLRHTFLRSSVLDISLPEDHSLPLCRILVNLLMNPSYLLTVLTVSNALMYLSALTFYAPSYALLVLTSS